MPTLPHPPPIRTDHSNAFANHTMRVRIPDIIAETIALNPDYPGSIKSRLAALRDEIAGDALIGPLDAESAADWLPWQRALHSQQKQADGDVTWHSAEWFFAETYAYRCLIQAARYDENGRDPFAPRKCEELRSQALWQLLERATGVPDEPEAALMRCVEFALWANRIDLSYAASLERGISIKPEDLLLDDRQRLIADLLSAGQDRRAEPIRIVADNTGSELAMDLVLSDCLLRHVSDRVIICLKAHPTFVSDATVADVWIMLGEMKKRGGSTAELAMRLERFWREGRLRFLPHPYWNSSVLLRDMPTPLRDRIGAGRLLILKGDVNYRRALGDCVWPAHAPFAGVMAYLECPALCLRTLKSDPIAGLPAGLAAKLDRVDRRWRVNGQRGLIQYKPAASGNL